MHLEDDLFDAAQVGLAGVEDLGLPAAQLGVLHVHAHQLGRPQVRLLAALGAAHLEDHVAFVVRIARLQELLQSVHDVLDLRLDRLDLLACERFEIVFRAVAQQQLGLIELIDQRAVALVLVDHACQLCLLAAQLGGPPSRR